MVKDVVLSELRPALRIDRSVDAVAALLFDPAREREWAPNIRAVRVFGRGPVGVGTRVEREVTFLGRTYVHSYEIAETDHRTYQVRVCQRPFPYTLTYRLEPDGTGTWVSAHLVGESIGFFGVAESFVLSVSRATMNQRLERLRILLESGA